MGQDIEDIHFELIHLGLNLLLLSIIVHLYPVDGCIYDILDGLPARLIELLIHLLIAEGVLQFETDVLEAVHSFSSLPCHLDGETQLDHPVDSAGEGVGLVEGKPRGE